MNPAFSSNKPTYYLLDLYDFLVHSDFLVLIAFEKFVLYMIISDISLEGYEPFKYIATRFKSNPDIWLRFVCLIFSSQMRLKLIIFFSLSIDFTNQSLSNLFDTYWQKSLTSNFQWLLDC